MKRILTGVGALAVMGTMVGGAAFAGGYATPVVEAPVAAPAPVVTLRNADWNGFYAGAQLGYGKPDGLLKTDGAFGGVHAGYLSDFGNFVAGGEVAYNAANMETGSDAKVKNFTDVKLIAGVPSGKWLTYGVLGASYVKADVAGQSQSDTVPVVGLGVKYQVNDSWVVGTELDYRKGDSFDNSNQDLNLTTIGASASFRF